MVVVQIIVPRRSHDLIVEAFLAGFPSFEAGIVRILQTPQAASGALWLVLVPLLVSPRGELLIHDASPNPDPDRIVCNVLAALRRG